MSAEKILIIEDDYSIRTNIRELLSSVGYRVFSCADGHEGVSLASEIMPDLIVCDIMMPGIDGYEVYSKISEGAENSFPFIFLSAKAEPDDFRKGMILGADDYITKPFKAAELLKAIEVRLKKYKKIKKSLVAENADNFKKEKKNLEEKILLKYKNKTVLITVNEISCIIANGEYSRIFSSNNKPILMRRVLKEWEALLPENYFLRVHRSYLININQVSEITSGYNGTFIIKMKNYPEPVISSRRYLKKIKEKLIK